MTRFETKTPSHNDNGSDAREICFNPGISW